MGAGRLSRRSSALDVVLEGKYLLLAVLSMQAGALDDAVDRGRDI